MSAKQSTSTGTAPSMTEPATGSNEAWEQRYAAAVMNTFGSAVRALVLLALVVGALVTASALPSCATGWCARGR